MNTSDLAARLECYLALRKALGFKDRALKTLLLGFVHHVAAQGVSGPIRAQVAVDWACMGSTQLGAARQAYRLSRARGFLLHLRASMPETEVPEYGLLASGRRRQPYLFSQEAIVQLLEAASLLGPPGSLRPHTYKTLIGLLASTGLRIGEAIRLTRSEVHLHLNPPRLEILQTKFCKSRLVPLHPTTAEMLRQYERQRCRLGYDELSNAFFVSETGKHLGYYAVRLTFIGLTRRLGLCRTDGRPHANLHSLRHTFAVERLLTWYQEGVDVRALLPHLSVYLGHVRPQESYWYLTATPQLLGAAAESFQHYANAGGDL